MDDAIGGLAAVLFLAVEFSAFIGGPLLVAAGFVVDTTLALRGRMRPASVVLALFNGALLLVAAVMYSGALTGWQSEWIRWLQNATGVTFLALLVVAVPLNLASWVWFAMRAFRGRSAETAPPVGLEPLSSGHDTAELTAR